MHKFLPGWLRNHGIVQLFLEVVLEGVIERSWGRGGRWEEREMEGGRERKEGGIIYEKLN